MAEIVFATPTTDPGLTTITLPDGRWAKVRCPPEWPMEARHDPLSDRILARLAGRDEWQTLEFGATTDLR